MLVGLLSFMLMIAQRAVADEPTLAAKVLELYTAPAAKQKQLVSALLFAKPTFAEIDAALSGPLPYARARTGLFTEQLTVKDDKVTRKIPLNLFVPDGYTGEKAFGVLLFLHPAGGSGLPWAEQLGGAATENSMIVCAPTEPGSANKGWLYSAFQREMHWRALDWIRRRYHVDDNRIVIGGASRGGHGAWDLALAHPDQFAGLLGLIGGPAPQAVQRLDPLAWMSFLILQGAKDEAGIVEPVRKTVAVLKEAGANVLYQEDAEAGHQFDLGAVDLPAWLSGAVRNPFPLKAAVWTEGEAGRRAFWLEVVRVAQGADKKPLPAHVTGTIKGTDKGSEIELQAQNAREIKLHLHDQLVALDKPIKVLVNGEVKHQSRVLRNMGTMVREVLDGGDRQVRCMAEITIR